MPISPLAVLAAALEAKAIEVTSIDQRFEVKLVAETVGIGYSAAHRHQLMLDAHSVATESIAQAFLTALDKRGVRIVDGNGNSYSFSMFVFEALDAAFERGRLDAGVQ